MLTLSLILFLITYLIHRKIFNSTYKMNHQFMLKDKVYKEALCIKHKKHTINGYLYYNDDTNDENIVIISHGLGSDHLYHQREIEYFTAMGYLVVGYDTIGVSMSYSKSLLGLGGTAKSLDIVFKYIEARYPKSKINVYSHSWGGYAALANTTFNNIHAVCAVAPFISFKQIFKDRLPRLCMILYPFFYLVERIRCGKYAFVDIKKALNSYENKALIVASRNDDSVSYLNHTDVLYKSIDKENIKFYICDDRFHEPMFTKRSVKSLYEIREYYKTLPIEERAAYKKEHPQFLLKELDADLFTEIDLMFKSN